MNTALTCPSPTVQTIQHAHQPSQPPQPLTDIRGSRPFPLEWAQATTFEVTPKILSPNHTSRWADAQVTTLPLQPDPFTPGLRKRMVYEHALRLFEGRLLEDWPFTQEGWFLAEMDLLEQLRQRMS
jgi:hypothetical protein